jgi:hypothetical protein
MAMAMAMAMAGGAPPRSGAMASSGSSRTRPGTKLCWAGAMATSTRSSAAMARGREAAIFSERLHQKKEMRLLLLLQRWRWRSWRRIRSSGRGS